MVATALGVAKLGAAAPGSPPPLYEFGGEKKKGRKKIQKDKKERSMGFLKKGGINI